MAALAARRRPIAEGAHRGLGLTSSVDDPNEHLPGQEVLRLLNRVLLLKSVRAVGLVEHLCLLRLGDLVRRLRGDLGGGGRHL